MNQTWYLVDNNALRDLGVARRKSTFFREHCRLTDDVLHEARYSTDISTLRHLRFPVTPRALEHARTIMKTVAVSDTGLIDLYGNKGAADPLLIAAALDAIDRDDGNLFPDRWLIVSRDKAVIAKATEFGVETMAPEELASLIDGST